MTESNELDSLFSAARSKPEQLDPNFLAELHMQAFAAMPKPRVGVWARLTDAVGQFGGWPVGVSLASAVVAGFIFGVSPPDTVLNITTAYFDTETVTDLSGISDYTTTLLEGI